MRTERVEVRLDAQTRGKLERVARARGSTVSELVRSLIEESYEEEARGERLRAAERIGAMGLEDVVLACALADRHAAGSPGAGRLAARDLLHAAVVLRLGVAEGSAEGSGRIVSADGDFDELAGSGIRRLDPADVGSWRREAEGRGT